MPIIDVYRSEESFYLPLGREVKEVENSYCRQQKIATYELMQRAGLSLWEHIQQRFPKAEDFIVITGPGNNAGDGFELARLALLAEKNVRIKFVHKNHSVKDYFESIHADAAIALKNLQNQSRYSSDSIAALKSDDDLTTDVIIDGLLGSGIKAPARAEFVAAIESINQSGQDVVSIDVPSGLDGDSGSMIGAAVNATSTVSFIGIKPGLVTADGKHCCGELYLDELEVGIKAFSVPRQLVSLKSELDGCDDKLLVRASNSHKGNFGRTLVIGGNHGMGGAALLAATAAYRCGSGAVMLITRSENVSATVEQNPEIMAIAGDDIADIESLESALGAVKSATAIIIGPGLGDDEWAEFWLTQTLARKVPTVVDADGLRLAKRLGFSLTGTIITPHPGEATALLQSALHTQLPAEVATQTPLDSDRLSNQTDKKRSFSVQLNRYIAAQLLQKITASTVVLKGAGTIIACKTTTKDVALVVSKVCRYGNSGMATAGMGDVLAGIIGSLLAQGYAKTEAAIIGTLIHSLSGDRAAGEQPIGLVASDLFPYIRQLRNELSSIKSTHTAH